MEPEVLKFIAELDPAAAPCVKLLRDRHPETPILLVEDRNYADSFLNATKREHNRTNQEALREEYAKMQQAKVAGFAEVLRKILG